MEGRRFISYIYMLKYKENTKLYHVASWNNRGNETNELKPTYACLESNFPYIQSMVRIVNVSLFIQTIGNDEDY